MLVLARKKDEAIIIGDDIEVMIVDIRGDRIRLGINAPREVSVHRKEIWLLLKQQAKPEEQKEAVGVPVEGGEQQKGE